MTETFARSALLLALLAPPAVSQSLAARLDRRLDAPGLERLFWGVAVADANGKLLYGRNAERLFVPASNTKLLVAVAALELLGPDFTVRTSLYGTGAVVDGVLQGDVILYGRGDPTFSRRCYDRDTLRAGACDRDPALKLRELARQLRARGVRAIAGDVVGDGSYFEPGLIHAGWQHYDLAWWYAAPVSGLGFNDNSLDVRETADSTLPQPRVTLTPDLGIATFDNRATLGPRGARRTFDVIRSDDGLTYTGVGVLPLGTAERTEYAAVFDPNRFAALALRRELLAEGISVAGATRATTDSFDYRHLRADAALAEVTSRPLRDWIFPILSTSQNWFAEMTLKQLGKRFGAAGSWEEGLKVERRFLIDSIRIDSTQFAVEDGSGLASNNLVAPAAFVRLLAFARTRPSFAAIDAALPISGGSGSLRQRFVGTAAAGRVKAKTGTISRVSTLSGYLERPGQPPLIFSVMANHHTLTGARITAAIDSVIVELGRAATPKQ